MQPTSLKAPKTSSTPTLPDFKKWYAEHAKEILSDYFTFLKFPSISTDPKYKEDVRRCSQWVAAHLKKTGLDVEIWETSVHPVIYGSYLKPGPSRPTVLIYHHYDVQPVDPIELWKSPPFEPVLKDGEVYARGASDNKGQCFYGLTALRAFFELCKQININIKVFIEGEEECGSIGSTEILSKKKKELKADHLLIIDMGLPAPNIPAITLGLRGIIALQVTLRNSRVDLHSGIHGGIALNTNRALINLLSKLWDERGKITVPRFYDEVQSVSKEELAVVDQFLSVEELKKNFGIRVFQGEGEFSLWESNTIRPTLEINGIQGGYTGIGFKTVIPAQAFAKISCRLVLNQDPVTIGKRVADFLKKNTPEGMEVEIQFEHGGKPVRSSPNTFIAKIAKSAYEEVFGRPCKSMLGGASVPIVADLKEAAEAEVAMIGMGLDSDDIHAPNEHFGLGRLEQGFLTLSRILTLLQE